LDPGDPINYARHVQQDPFDYESTGEQGGAHVLSTSLLGDMAVSSASGIAWARAAGLVNFLDDDPRFGKPVNQFLLDSYTLEGVSTHNRHVNADGLGVLLDIERFSDGMPNKWGASYPQSSQALRIGVGEKDVFGGESGVAFPLSLDVGEHVFTPPGGMLDEAITECQFECFNSGDPACTCDDVDSFDIGFFIVNTIGRWFASGATSIDYDLCNSRNNCADIPPLPSLRSTDERL
jgi:hypothetical protein